MHPTRVLLLASALLFACTSETEDSADTATDSSVRPGRDAGGDSARDFGTDSEFDMSSDVEDTGTDSAPDGEPDAVTDSGPDTPDGTDVAPDTEADVAPDAETDTLLDAGSDTPDPAVCGDSLVSETEGCDDGNTVGGDGCDSACERELYFVCRPCDSDDDCGQSDDLCIDGACGADCTVLGCGDGFDCVETTVDGFAVSQCVPTEGCPQPPPEEICEGLVDDDGDGLTDCIDPDCFVDPLCAGTGDGTCADPIPATLGRVMSTPTNEAQSPSCLSIDNVESVFVWTPSVAGVYCLDTRGSGASDTLISTRTVCGDVDTELTCDDDIPGDLTEFQAHVDFNAVGTNPIYVLVDTYNPDDGDTLTLTISEGRCGAAPDEGGGPDPDPVDYGIIGCLESLDDLDATGTAGEELHITCPPDCSRWDFVYGTDIYSADSYLCSSAIHQGSTTDSGGLVSVTVLDGREEYTGTTRNGVRSSDWSFGFDRSFSTSAR